jgi:hypothetical protein
MFIRREGNAKTKNPKGETRGMLDMITVVLAGLGGASLTAAFLDYRFSRKRRTETKEHA